MDCNFVCCLIVKTLHVLFDINMLTGKKYHHGVLNIHCFHCFFSSDHNYYPWKFWWHYQTVLWQGRTYYWNLVFVWTTMGFSALCWQIFKFAVKVVVMAIHISTLNLGKYQCYFPHAKWLWISSSWHNAQIHFPDTFRFLKLTIDHWQCLHSLMVFLKHLQLTQQRDVLDQTQWVLPTHSVPIDQ